MRAKKLPRVLIAEDDRETRMALAAALRRSGYVVTEARDGATAVDHIGSCLLHVVPDPPDIVVAAARMPIMNGLQVLASMRPLGVPVILIDVRGGDPTTRALAQRLGAVAVFDRPCDVVRMCETIETLVPIPVTRESMRESA
jgi:DNA-binding response OmpR family regulator